jgi:hypothetical protein
VGTGSQSRRELQQLGRYDEPVGHGCLCQRGLDRERLVGTELESYVLRRVCNCDCHYASADVYLFGIVVMRVGKMRW